MLGRCTRVKRWVVLSTAVGGTLIGVGAARAGDAAWTGGATTGAWEDSANWNPNSPPGATGTTNNPDTATFNTNPTTLAVVPDAGRNLANITFDTASAGAFVIGTTGGNALLLTDGGTTQTTSTVAQIETINAPLVLEGTGATAYTFNSSAASNANILKIGGAISGASGTPTLTLTGTNLIAFPNNGSGAAPATNTISGIISNGSATSLAIAKTGAGSWTLSGANTYTGGTSVGAGVLTVRNNSALGSGDVNVAAGAQLQFGPNGLSVANNVTLNGISTGGALVGGVDTGGVATTLSGQLTLAATSNLSTYWSDKSLTITGKVTGPGGLQIDRALPGNNAPVIILANGGNDFAGGSKINTAGAVLAFSSGALSTGNVTFATSGTLRWNGTNTQDVSGKITTIGTGITATLDTNGNNVAFANPISAAGTGTITKAGGGTLTLPSTAAYTGTTTISGGVLSTPTLSDTGNSGIGTGGVTLTGGTLQYTGATPVSTTRTFNANNTAGGSIDISNAAGSLEITSAFAGNAASVVNKLGAGMLTLSGATDNAALVLNAQAGTVQLNKSAASMRAVAGISNIAPGATVQLTGAGSDQISGGGYSTTAPGNGLVNMSGGTFDLNGKSESIDRLTGTGVVTNNGAAGTTSTLTLGESNGTTPAANGNVTLFSGTIKDGANGGKVALVKVGTGIASLNGPQTYTGGTTISGGTLRLGVVTSTVPVTGAQMWLDASDTSSVTTSGTSVSSWNDKSGKGNNATQGTAANQPTYIANDTVGGKNVIHFSASGQVFSAPLDTILNNSAYTIFSVEGKQSTGNVYYLGTLNASNNKGLHVGYRTDNDYTLAQYGNDLDYVPADNSLKYTSPNQVFRVWDDQLNTSSGHSIALNGTVVASNGSTTALSSPGAGVIGQGYSGASTQYIGDLGEIIVFNTALDAQQRLLVDTYLQEKWLGTLSSNVLPTSTAVNVSAAGAALDLNGASQQIGSLTGVTGSSVILGASGGNILTVGDGTSTTFAGAISGAGGVTKQGAGTLALTGDSNYTGPTSITAGKLVVGQGGAGSLSGSAVTVSGTGTLGGGGSITGPVSITSGGTLAPGNSVGTIATGTLSLVSGATLSAELDPTNAQGNGTADLVAVTGTVSLTGSTLSLALLSQPTLNQQFTIINNDGTDPVVGTFANGPTFTVGSAQFSINYAGGDGNDVVLTTTAVPEPASAALLALGAVGLLASRRRRSARSGA